MTQASPALGPERLRELSAIMANPKPVDDASQTAWLSLQGAWFDGWELQCMTGGTSKNYFAPDSRARVVGPRLYSKSKLASVVGVAVVVIALIAAGLSYIGEHGRRLGEAANTADIARKTAEAARQTKEQADRLKVERDGLLATVAANASPGGTVDACVKLESNGGVPPERQQLCANAAVLAALEDLAHAQAEDKILDAVNRLEKSTSAAASFAAPVRVMLNPYDEAASAVAELQPKLDAAQSDSKAEDKPVFEKPAYTGAQPIYGTFRGPYKGGLFGGGSGIVIQSGNKYYVIQGADVSIFTDDVQGYAKPTGNTVTLDIGNGREAEVLTFAEVESYTDDQKAYREEVADATKTFQEAQRKWSDAARQAAALKRQLDPLARKKAELIKTIPVMAAKLLQDLYP
jgi:hypothetical protein